MNLCIRTDKDIERIYNQYFDMVYRVCFMYFKNKHDTLDAVQTTFIKLMEYRGEFHSQEHIKAWLLVTSSNICKNSLKHWWHQKVTFDEEVEGSVNFTSNELLEFIVSLPKKYKIILYLYYYEGYKTKEIASMLKINESTIRSQLLKARTLLKQELGGDYAGE